MKYICVDDFCRRMKSAYGGCDPSMCNDCSISKAEKIEIIHCKECKSADRDLRSGKRGVCYTDDLEHSPNDFCSYGR